MSEKIVVALNLAGMNEINYTQYLSSIRSSMMAKGQKEQIKFCFNLFDHDGNGFVCARDLDVLNTQFTGTSSLLQSDFLALASMFNFKQTHENYKLHLMKVPTQILKKKTGGLQSTSASPAAKRPPPSPLKRMLSKPMQSRDFDAVEELKLEPETSHRMRQNSRHTIFDDVI